MPLVKDILRADIYFILPTEEPTACLVMCPGINGNGEHYLSRPDLLAFADRYNLALVALSFASDEDALTDNRGYYYASQGSGKLLIDAIDRNIHPDIPLLLYGFSGGAHFVSSFEESFPQRVAAWCAYTAAWWDDPKPNEWNPPGIVACGKLDLERYDLTFTYFQQGRKLGKPWCWLSLADTNHSESDKLNRFVESFFGSILDKKGDGAYFDNKTKQKLEDGVLGRPEDSSWLPTDQVADKWTILHKP